LALTAAWKAKNSDKRRRLLQHSLVQDEVEKSLF